MSETATFAFQVGHFWLRGLASVECDRALCEAAATVELMSPDDKPQGRYCSEHAYAELRQANEGVRP